VTWLLIIGVPLYVYVLGCVVGNIIGKKQADTLYGFHTKKWFIWPFTFGKD
jgi:hypothetical protein